MDTIFNHNKYRAVIMAAVAVIGLSAVVLACYGCGGTPSSDSGNSSSSSSSAATTWSSDMDCTTCHTTEAASMSNSACLASKHQAQGAKCTTCHNDATTLASVHADMSTAKVPTKLSKTTVDNSVCLGCHGSWDALAAKTTNVTVLTDANGTVVNPHSITSAAIDVKGQHDKIQCVDCHSMHTTDTADTLGPAECLSCHHQNVYQCGTCHAV